MSSLNWSLKNASGYVLLSNIYTAAGNIHLCEDVEQQRKERCVKKQPGHTSIEVNNEVHKFIVEDQDPQFEIVRAHARCRVCAIY
jgi:hypothetical protein